MLGRHWLFRVSIAANSFVVFYFAIYSSSTQFGPTSTPYDLNLKPSLRKESSQTKSMEAISLPPQNIIPPPQANSESSHNSFDKVHEIPEPPAQQLQSRDTKVDREAENKPLKGTMETSDSQNGNNKLENELEENGGEKVSFKEAPVSREVAHMDFEMEDAGGNFEEKGVSFDVAQRDQYSNIPERPKLFQCDDYTPETHFGQRGPFWVLYNYIKPRKHFPCDESITYTTHADFTFLDNLIPLLERWEGPISLTLYSPGTDFNNTLNRINYLRECTNGSALVKDYVSFHLFFDYKHTPKTKIPSDPGSIPVNCSAFKTEDIQFGEHLPTYKKTKKLPYPVNVARNVAREMSTTHYVFPSDIELYPNPKLIPDFLDMIRRNDTPELQRPNPNKLYVLSIFEVEANVTRLPQDKSELVYMLNNKTAIPFHKFVCANCHRIPKAKEWIAAPMLPGLNVFHVGKRYKPYHHWEPIFIGTKKDPFYDERLTWEGRSDKMTQGYVLCVLDYEFHILDNAFLVHRPGIKRTVTIPSKNPVVSRQNTVISKIILPELKQLFGTKSGCYV